MNRTTALRRTSAALTALFLTSALAGCAESSQAAEPTGALAVVVGARSNMPSTTVTGQAAAALGQAAAQQSYFSVVVADGAPYVADEGLLAAEGGAGSDPDAWHARNRQRLDDSVAAARARTPETDLLGALRVAADSIAAQPGPRTIVVLDSGLSTTGALDLTQPDMLDAVPQEVADTLGRSEELPWLGGVSVLFSGLGATAEPQAELDRIRRAQLTDLWTTVARTAGASHVQVERGQGGGEPAGDLPPVTPVPVPPGYVCSGTTMTLTGGRMSYRHDTSAFLDPETARDVLRPLAEEMKARGLSAVLHGMTADVRDPAEQQMLSYLQAQAIADMWLEEGVPERQLVVVGLGSDFPGYVPDRDAEGELIPSAAAANRKVTITFSAPVDCG
ncbi:OmpA family protein [Geodermatophilus sp. SYSU D00758]